MSIRPEDVQNIRSEKEFNRYVKKKIKNENLQEWIIGARRGQKIFEFMSKFNSNLPSSLILDMGCGFGGISMFLSKITQVLGLDINRESLRVAHFRKKIAKRHNLLFVRGSATDLPIRSGVFDKVLISGAMEWVPCSKPKEDPESTQLETLMENVRILKERGMLFLAIENRYYLRYWLGVVDHHSGLRFVPILPRKVANLISFRMKGKPYLTRTYSYSELRKLVQIAGLEIMKVYIGIPDYVFPQDIVDLEDKYEISRKINSIRKRRSRRIIWQIISKIGLMRLFGSNFIVVCQKRGPAEE